MVKRIFDKIQRKIGLNLPNPIYLFSSTLIVIIAFYLYFLGEDKTIEIVKEEYLLLIALIPLFATLIYFKIKLKDYQLINFNNNQGQTLKTTIMFFLVFQVVDYYYEDGFIGMISQWFLYWVMGVIAVLILEIINHYKNYKILFNK